MYIQVENNVQIFVEDLNPRGQETLLLVHGWPLSHKMFEYQTGILPAFGIRCVSIDLRGFGDSDKPWGGYDYDTMCEDIHKVIHALKLDNITLLGFSMGGAIAAKYAAKYGGDKVKKLILLGAAAPFFLRRPDFPYGMTNEDINKLIIETNNDKPKAFEGFSGLVFEKDISPAFMNWFGNFADEAGLYSASKCLESLRDSDVSKDLEKIKIPTAIFHGIKDRVCPFQLTGQMKSRIKNSFILPFNNSGHGLFFEEKDKLNSAILDFIKPSNDIAKNPSILSSVTENSFAAGLQSSYKFENIPLHYGYTGLEPSVDEKTMQLHHDKHLQTYIDNLNAALISEPLYQNRSLERLLLELKSLPEPLRTAVAHSGGGVYNHFFYFGEMSKTPQNIPSGELAELINATYGSLDNFKKEFKAKALSVFGSGYAWLVLDRSGKAEIVTTSNQDTPLTYGMYPLINIDMWEHAYYLKHYNNRAAYIDDWFNVLDFKWAQERINKLKDYSR